MQYTEQHLVERVQQFRYEMQKETPERAVENIRLYLVGGAVRDKYMGITTSNDRDYCVTGITESEMIRMFPEAKLVGASYPVFLLEVDGNKETEIALARTEEKVGVGYHGTTAHTDTQLTIIDDLARRDLTINAMALDLETKTLIDPYHGKDDIKKGIIRATSKKFAEDPLRIIRAARFAARYQFTIEETTLTMMNQMKHELAAISGERYFLEMGKAIDDRQLVRFFEWLEKAGAMDEAYELNGKQYEGHFKEFAYLKQQEPVIFASCLAEVDQLPSMDKKIAFAVLLQTFSQNDMQHISQKWKMPKEYVQLIAFCNETIDHVRYFNQHSKEEKVTFLSALIAHPLTKQSFSKKEPLFLWFTSVMAVRCPSLQCELQTIEQLATQMNAIKVTEEIIKKHNLTGKEIAAYVLEQRKLLLT